MSDYERGIRDAISFVFSHVVEASLAVDGQYERRIKPASPETLAWSGTVESRALWLDSAVNALVTEEQAA